MRDEVREIKPGLYLGACAPVHACMHAWGHFENTLGSRAAASRPAGEARRCQWAAAALTMHFLIHSRSPHPPAGLGTFGLTEGKRMEPLPFILRGPFAPAQVR